MYVCKKCNGHRIKTRSNKSYGKSTSTAVKCRDCNSTDIENINPKKRRFNRRR